MGGQEIVPFIPGNELHGLRVNCELVEPDHPGWTELGIFENNLQSFLIVQDAASGNAPALPLEDVGGGEEMSAAASPQTSLPQKRLATSILVETHASAISQALAELAKARAGQGR